MKRTIQHLLGGRARPLGVEDVEVSGVAYRSDRVSKGDAFFCIRGFAHDGHDFAADAAVRGAAAIVVETPTEVSVPQFLVEDTRVALAEASAESCGHPSRKMHLVGVTGTNGKTTTTYLVDSILRAAGHTTGLTGTVETRIAGERLPSSRTTPESADMQDLLVRMLDAGASACSMEVSSHAIDLHRVDAMHFSVAAFTNLTQDHLDFHHTIEEYYSVKKRLFTDLDVDRRVINTDDPFGVGIASELEECVAVGRNADASVRAENERPGERGSIFDLITPTGEALVHLPLAGAYNVNNALVAAGCGIALGIKFEHIISGLESAPQVPGRLERIDCGQDFLVFVDYAHTPDSLEKVISAVREVTPGRVITLFGCGGDRDPDKRPMMGTAASTASDHVIVTSDNPRSEDPVGIILQIEDGLNAGSATHEVEVDRRAAIQRAVSLARRGDAVLIAGKGHEDYQEFADRTIHFDDREVAREVLAAC